MPTDFIKFQSTLNQSKALVKHDGAYQALFNLLKALQDFADGLDGDTSDLVELQNAIRNARVIRIIEPDTSTDPQVRDLADDLSLQRMVIYKDYQGNASVNNITLTGTVDNVVNPVINTDYGIYRVYQSATDGLYYTW